MHNTYLINNYTIQRSKTTQWSEVLKETCDLDFKEKLGKEWGWILRIGSDW